MNQSKHRKYLEAKANLIVKEDRKFVAKIAGQTGCGKLSGTTTGFSRSGNPHSSGRPSQPAAASAQCSQHAHQASRHADTPDGSSLCQSTQRTASPVSRVTPDFQPPDIGPAWLAAATALQLASSQADRACTEQVSDAPAAQYDLDCHTQQQTAEQPASPSGCKACSESAGKGDSIPQQLVSWLPESAADRTTQQEQIEATHLTAAVDAATGAEAKEAPAELPSPSWLLKTAAANSTAHPGTIQIESSLYRSWADGCDTAQVQVASNQQHKQPSTAAASVNPCSTLALKLTPAIQGDIVSQTTNGVYPVLQLNGSVSGCQSRTTATSAAVDSWSADMFATAGVKRANSPTGTRRAAAAVAGLGSTIQDSKYQSWLKVQFPGVKPPKREDTKSLRQWLQKQLQQLQHSHEINEQPEVSNIPVVGGLSPDAVLASRVKDRGRNPIGTVMPPASPAAPAQSSDSDKAVVQTSSMGAGWYETGFEAQTSQLLLTAQGPDGALSVEKLKQQEAVYSAAFHELCGQVSVGCIERGHLMAQLWLSMRAMLLAVLADQQAARTCEAAAHAATAEAKEEVDRLQTLQDDERVALRAISERHAARAEAAKQQMEAYKHKCEQLQDLLERLSGAQQLVQRVFNLETAKSEQAATISHQEQVLAGQGQQVEELQQQVKAWQSRALTAEGMEQSLAQELRCRTPRPKRDLGMLSDLLTPAEAQLVEQALIDGMPALHVHRLLLGLSPEGEDMRPWVDLTGTALQALHAAKDGYQMHQHLQQLLESCDALGVMKHLQPPESIQLLSQAVHMGAQPAMLMQLMDGSLGLPVFGEAAEKAANCEATTALIGPADAKSHKAQPPKGSASSSESSSNQKVVFTFGIGAPYLPLLGILATKYGHNASELGGHVTEALVQGQMPTKSRVADLELKTKSMHREIMLLKRSLAEQRKHEKERINAALRDQKRKIARREARPPNILEKFLQTKWGDYFMGIGLQDEVPKVLRANVPINNKRMSKREAEKLAKEIWQAKDEHEASTGTRVHLADFTGAFLERRFFAIPRLTTEVAYNLIYCLGQHSYDADCNLFLRIFTADVEEAVRYEQQALEAEIIKLLRLLDISINHQATGWLHKADVKTALAGYFKGKKVDRLAEIFEALDTDDPGDALHYSVMFIDDDDLNQGMTAETIRAQHLQERLEFMQEIDNAIRDAAEDHQTTSLTPFMLQAALSKANSGLPAERAIDEATCDGFVARAFGPDWKDQQYRISQPISTIIRAICRGSLNNALRGPAAATAAVAVSKIQPVGKFKGKLMSALKVGMNEPSGSGRLKDRRISSSAGPSGAEAGNPERRKSAIGLLGGPSNNVSTTSSRPSHSAGSPAQWTRRASMDVVTAAAAAVLTGSSLPGTKKRSNRITFSEGGIGAAAVVHRPASAVKTLSRSTTALLQQQQQEQPADSAAEDARKNHDADAAGSQMVSTNTLDAAAAEPDPVAPDGGSCKKLPTTPPVSSSPHALDNSSSSRAMAALPSLSIQRTTSSVTTSLGSARGNNQVLSSTVSDLGKRSALGSLSKTAHADTMTVGMLSAMEAVRQSWLKEEEHKLSLSGAAACSASGGQKPRVNFTDFISLSGTSSSPSATMPSPLQQQAGVAAILSSTTDSPGQAHGGSYSHAGSLRIPAVPALQLLELSERDADCASSCSNRSLSTVLSTNRASGRSSLVSTARRGVNEADSPVFTPRGGSEGEQRSLPLRPRPALKTSASSAGRHVQLKVDAEEDGGSFFDFQGGCGSPQATAGRTSAVSTPRAILKGSTTAAQDAADSSKDKCIKGSASRRKRVQHPPMLLLTDADDVVTATASLMSASGGLPGAISFNGAASSTVPGQACSSPTLPGWLNSVCGLSSSGSASLSSCGGAGQSSNVIGPLGHDDVCYTPHAPEEGGKMNALLMRKLNKGKSLKRLEEVMLMVASQAGGAAEQEEWS